MTHFFIDFQFKFPTYPRCTLHDDFGKFLADRQFCDVQFIVGMEEVRIPAHIAMIAARSSVLKDRILYVISIFYLILSKCKM